MSPVLTQQRLHSLAWVRERVAYSREQIAGIFGLQVETAGDIILTLLSSGILRQVQKGETNVGADPVESFIGKGDFAFSFVGLYCYRGHLVYSLPKYVTTEKLAEPEICAADSPLPVERAELFAQVLRVITRYNSGCKREFSDSLHERAADCYLALPVTLLCDYAEHGEYRNDSELISRNTHGRILWNRTINSTLPFIQNAQPVYVDTYAARTVDAEEDFFTRLHRVVVKECCHMLSQFRLTELLGLPEIEAIEESSDELGGVGYLIRCVENELSQQFDSRRRHILQLLLAYFQQHCEEDLQPDTEFMLGCTHFHTVWEEVCRATLGQAVSHEIAPPDWQLSCGRPGAVSTLRPDMVFERGAVVYVLDAKYYLPVVRNGVINGLPGVNDVTKQFLYEQEFAYRRPGRKVFNAFLLPMPSEVETGEPFERYGNVSMTLFPGRRIEVFRLHAQQLYAAYLSGSRCDWLELMFSQI